MQLAIVDANRLEDELLAFATMWYRVLPLPEETHHLSTAPTPAHAASRHPGCEASLKEVACPEETMTQFRFRLANRGELARKVRCGKGMEGGGDGKLLLAGLSGTKARGRRSH